MAEVYIGALDYLYGGLVVVLLLKMIKSNNMKTPAEKAEMICTRYYNESYLLVEYLSWPQIKQCALMAVDEVLEALEENKSQNKKSIEYYLQVKEEIKLLE